MDRLTKQQRSECMSRIGGKNTNLEHVFKKHIRASGIKGYRSYANIPGRPDLYFPNHKLAVFIDGCFWHGCPRCASFPATNKKFWNDKIGGNKKRDRVVNVKLRKLSIHVIRFWGHDIKKSPDRCVKKLQSFIAKSRLKSSKPTKISVK